MIKINKYQILILWTFLRKIIELNFTKSSTYFAIEIFTDFILALFIISDVVKKKISFNKKDFTPLFLLLLTQIIAFLYSFFITKIFNVFIYRIVEFIECFFLLYIFAKRDRISEKNYELLLKTIIFMTFISTIYAMIFQLGGNLFKVSATANFRMDNIYQSFLGHRNQFGIVLVSGCMACFYFIISKKSRKIMSILFILFLANLIFTFSRASYVLLVVFVLSYYFLGNQSFDKKIKNVILGLIICVIFIFFYKSNLELKTFVDKFMIREESGMTGRDSLWMLALSFLNLPTVIFGRGFNISRLLLRNDTIGGGVGFHNMYLTHIVSGGIFMIFFFISIIKNVYNSIKKSNMNDSLKRYFISCIISFLIYSIFEVTDFFKISLQQTIQTMFCITFPILYINIKKGEKKNE